jgi:lipopolysaccharide/colanic/teichoic acid biosynthesis glycosyltransferase
VLPPIRKGVLNPSSALVKQTQEEERRLDLIYAKNYSVRGDFNIILRAIRFLGK